MEKVDNASHSKVKEVEIKQDATWSEKLIFFPKNSLTKSLMHVEFCEHKNSQSSCKAYRTKKLSLTKPEINS